MIKKVNKNSERTKRHIRLRHDLIGTTERPRLNVYRSLKHIEAQIIDDVNGKTLVACSTKQPDIQAKVKDMTNKEQAKFVGEQIGKLALSKKIDTVVFDRGGYLYTGRVKELAEGARAAGLEF